MEIALTTVLVFVTCILIACVINIVGSILGEINEKDKKFSKELDVMNHYMLKF